MDLNGKNYALYRFPHQDEYTIMCQTCGEPLALSSFEGLQDVSGFVFAPFYVTAEHPLLVLTPDVVKSCKVDCGVDFEQTLFKGRDVMSERAEYGKVFSCFHDALKRKTFSKIVLSRSADEVALSPIDTEKLFMRACMLYPRMFIALVSMPQCGTWLMATPEILLESRGETWHTMALAGTMSITESDTDEALSGRKTAGDISEWNRKNIQEQRYVADYIGDCLCRYSDSVMMEGPYSLRAGAVKHLASDFCFSMDKGKTVGELVGKLHPTPAVCGLPKSDAYDFIRSNEGHERSYYSGFAGPWNYGNGGTHLYVTLRCMSIDVFNYRLYAGGGLLPESEEEKEWFETEAKMDTMRRCLAIKRI